MSKFFIFYLILVVILFNFLNESNQKKFKFIQLNEWTQMASNSSNVYLYNDNYCVKESNFYNLTNSPNLSALSYSSNYSNPNITTQTNSYYCVSNVKPVYTQVNFTELNITSITPLDTSKSNSSFSLLSFNSIIYIVWILVILSFYLKSNSKNIFSQAINQDDVKTDSDSKTTIDNFIGCANIKNDIDKVINHIKYNSIYKKFNCEIPKGIMLLGPPGCGKTHLVKTIIKSTGINYLFTSGSDINKIFVGSGSLNISNLFEKARASKPCLIFIDEADTLIRKRAYGQETSSGATNELGSTLCKLLAELDSIKTEAGIVVVFASNMPEDQIDKALLRAGRVDQIIHIGYPTLDERIELFKMYLGDMMNESIDLNLIGKLTYGLTGSDIKKIINSIKINKVYGKTIELNNNTKDENKDGDKNKEETDIVIDGKKELFSNITKSLIQRIRKLKKNNNFDENDIKIDIKPTTSDIDKEINKCILGLERERKINLTNKKLISYHETGHAIMSFLLKDTKLPTKICISITSKTLGYTMYTQDDEDLIMGSSITNLIAQVMILYAGRSAEKLFMCEITGGAEDDYMKARKILKRLVMNGMIYPEFNYVETNGYNGQEPQKIPEHIEKILSKINKYLIQEVDQILIENSDIVKLTAEKIQELGSINNQDITNIFESTGKTHLIQSIGTDQFYKHIGTF